MRGDRRSSTGTYHFTGIGDSGAVGGNGTFGAPVQVPAGATITAVKVFVKDGAEIDHS